MFSYIFMGLALLGWGGYMIIWVVIGGPRSLATCNINAIITA